MYGLDLLVLCHLHIQYVFHILLLCINISGVVRLCDRIPSSIFTVRMMPYSDLCLSDLSLWMIAQVVGKKTVWLSSPETSPYMYPYPENDESRAEGTAQSALAHLNPAANNVEPLMSNTSRVDVFASDTSNYPLFAEHIIPSAMCATLEPGDLLFFPPGWWHALRSEEVSFSVSMWF